MPQGVCGGEGLILGRARGDGGFFRESDATLGQGEALAGDIGAVNVVDQGHHGGGLAHIGGGLADGFPSVELGELEHRRDELVVGQRGDFGGGVSLLAATLRHHVAPPVVGDGALADAESEPGADEAGHFDIGAVFIIKPDKHLLVLLGGEALQFGVAADFPRLRLVVHRR